MHVPVLIKETLDLLNLQRGMYVVDMTLGLGGHSLKLIQAIGPSGKLLAFEQDERNLKVAKENLKDYQGQITFVHDNFEHLKFYAEKHHFGPIQAILFDLGLSSPHIDDPERGFAFKVTGPLDMRFDPRQKLTAADVINTYPENELADILFKYGEERRSGGIAKKIVHARKEKPFKTTTDLADFITSFIPRSGKIHPATQTFQALRIYVNRELEVLEKALKNAIELLAPKGRIAIISYHSLEDRLVKQTLKYYTQKCICPKEIPICQCQFQKKLYLITKKPIIPTGIEVLANPRSRSAKLRVAERL